MRGILRFAPSLLLLGGLQAATVTLDTGNAASVGTWQVSGPSNGNVTSNVVNLGQNPNGVWLTAPGSSQWVGVTSSDANVCATQNGITTGCPIAPNGQNGTYTYSLSFTSNGTGGSLTFTAAADNQVTIQVFVDGVAQNYVAGSNVSGTTFTHPGNTLDGAGCAFLPAGSGTCGGSGFGMVGGTVNWSGGSTVRIVASVTNGLSPVPSPTGFLLQGQATVNPGNTGGVPEPSTYAMLGLGSVALIAARLRRK